MAGRLSSIYGGRGGCAALGAVALGSVPRRIVPELRHFHWPLKMNNQSNSRNSKTVLRGTDPIASATAPYLRLYCADRYWFRVHRHIL